MVDSFIWYELMADDTDAAIDFYSKVVGWTVADHPNSSMPGGMRYAVLSAGENGIGGILQLDEAMKNAGVKPMWVGYIGVADTDDAARRIAEAGGTIHVPPMDIPNVGRFAMAADPGGAAFYVMTPAPTEDRPDVAPDTPGHVSWRELYSSAGEQAAFTFYSGLFGWQTMMEMPMGPMGTYRIFGDGETQWGGMMNKPEEMPASRWNFYVTVDSVEAAAERVKAGGGRVLMGPMQVPDDSFVIQAVDPQGAAFSLRSVQR
ncbi:MAG TPA: VOC family protein [Allosphingosinicella sp.]|nr:VOC family protein [Allosphingosinicella sp.]